jgi:hypothetical protein
MPPTLLSKWYISTSLEMLPPISESRIDIGTSEDILLPSLGWKCDSSVS